ncbi:NO-inducible flavohemoprotein [Falsirhodobacter sp. 1013]|uniref:NO-inducible flavohemoprotein n=1 Tax=Falsirhodobacter sp. 1013 TaxID=3417566 RepID=UPI003EBA1027
MPKPLSSTTVAVVKATVPALAEHGAAITAAMYARLFQDPEIRALFNHANQGEDGHQVHALAAAILAYARNIEDLSVLTPVVERIAQKHVGFHILPEHYPFVAEALLTAIQDVLGDAATEDILTAWGEAYWFLADILKDREAALRDQLNRAEGGWTGWRRFVVAEKIRESGQIMSFILRPEDGGVVLRHKAGQYLTLRLSNGMKRNYSISCASNGQIFRITVKQQADGKGGSRLLHESVQIGDVLECTPPSGDFFLPDHLERPVILLSGGVGLTPMVAMAEAIAAEHPGAEAWFVYGTQNASAHALGPQIAAAARVSGMHVATFYSDPRAQDSPVRPGRITMDWLKENTPLSGADIYLCGPRPFLTFFVSELRKAGVPPERMHFEVFGPTDEQIAA